MYSSKDFTSQELAGMPSKPHPITCLASAGILVYKYELVKGLSEKTTRESADLECLFQLWKRAWYDELSMNARMENKLIEFLRSRSIFVARMDRVSYKIEELNDKIMMCGLFNTWANYVIEQKEHAYGQLPMRVFIHDAYRLRSASTEHVRLDWLTCWMTWNYYMLDKKYNNNTSPLFDDCYD